MCDMGINQYYNSYLNIISCNWEYFSHAAARYFVIKWRDQELVLI